MCAWGERGGGKGGLTKPAFTKIKNDSPVLPTAKYYFGAVFTLDKTSVIFTYWLTPGNKLDSLFIQTMALYNNEAISRFEYKCFNSNEMGTHLDEGMPHIALSPS